MGGWHECAICGKGQRGMGCVGDMCPTCEDLHGEDITVCKKCSKKFTCDQCKKKVCCGKRFDCCGKIICGADRINDGLLGCALEDAHGITILEKCGHPTCKYAVEAWKWKGECWTCNQELASDDDEDSNENVAFLDDDELEEVASESDGGPEDDLGEVDEEFDE